VAEPTTAARSPRPPKPRGKVKRLAKVQRRAPRRFAVTYDVNGPRVRLGFLWFLVVMASVAVGPGALTAVYATTAGLAGFQAARTWQPLGRPAQPVLAAIIGAGIAAAGLLGPAAVGAASLGAAVVALGAAVAGTEARQRPFAAVAYTLQSGWFVGLAAATPVLALRIDIGAAAALVLLVSVYDMGDFLVGSGSKNAVEGPFAGIVAVAVFTFAMWVVTFVPFKEDALLAFGAVVAVAAPLGQLVGSAILPRSDARAPALRRLDSLLVAGPAWVVTLWRYLEIL